MSVQTSFDKTNFSSKLAFFPPIFWLTSLLTGCELIAFFIGNQAERVFVHIQGLLSFNVQ